MSFSEHDYLELTKVSLPVVAKNAVCIQLPQKFCLVCYSEDLSIQMKASFGINDLEWLIILEDVCSVLGIFAVLRKEMLIIP